MSTKKEDDKSDDASPKILSKPSSPTLSENSIVFPVDKDKPSTSVKKVVEKMKPEKPSTVDRGSKPQPSTDKGRSEKPHDSSKSSSKPAQPISKSAQSLDDETAPAERKVSRYSERRNKIKEKQISKVENVDVAIEAVQTNDESTNNSGEINSSEIQ